MDESIQGVETMEMDTPQADANSQADVEQTPQGQEVENQPSQDKRDWEAYARKLEAENKDFKSTFKARQADSKATQASTPVAPEQQEAIDLLRGIVREEFNQVVAPITEQFASQQEERVLDAFQKDPYVRALGPEINEALDKLPSYMANAPLDERLEFARAKAIANNADKIAEINQQLGMEKAYSNQDTKTRSAGLGQTRSRAGEMRDSVVDRVLRGENVSEREYRENHAEIQEAMRDQVFGG